MKFCTHCGNELRDEAIICPKCGCGVEAAPVKAVKVPEPVIPDKKFCTYCGAEVLPAAIVCPKCGCPVKSTAKAAGKGNGLQTAATVLMVINCALLALAAVAMVFLMVVFCAMYSSIYYLDYAEIVAELGMDPRGYFALLGLVYLIPLIWGIPMTVHYFKATKNKKPVGVGFKVCTLLFVNLVAGILMLCDNSNNK